MEFTTVEEIEDLHHHKSIEDERKMPGVNMQFFMNLAIVISSIDPVKSPRSDCPTNFSVMVLKLWMTPEESIIVSPWILRN